MRPSASAVASAATRKPAAATSRPIAAAFGYFAWIGYLTAPLPLLLLNLRAFKRSPQLAYHAWNATAWSLFVGVIRGTLAVISAWAGSWRRK